MEKHRSVALGLMLCLVVVSAEANAGLSAAELKDEIEKYGARIVVEKLTDTSWARFDRVCRMVETGNRKWLTVAKLLKSGTDAGSAESLDFAVARALPKAPADVLLMVQGEEHNTSGGFGLDDVCTVPFLEEDQTIVNEYLREAEQALEKMKDVKRNARLEGLRTKCLQRIRSFRAVK